MCRGGQCVLDPVYNRQVFLVGLLEEIPPLGDADAVLPGGRAPQLIGPVTGPVHDGVKLPLPGLRVPVPPDLPNIRRPGGVS